MPSTNAHPALPPAPRSALGAFVRRPVFWAALGLALLVHLGFLFSALWWHLPWQQPAPRMALLLRTLELPPAQTAAPPTPPEATAAAPTQQAPITEVVTEPGKKPKTPAEPQPAPTPQTAAAAAPQTVSSSATNAAASSLVLEMEAPPSTEFDFALSVNNPKDASKNASGQATLQWQNLGSTYQAQLQLRTAGEMLRVWQSTGTLVANGLQPLRFSETRAGSSEQAVHFDYAANQIIFSNNQATQALASGVQDPLSTILQLGALVGAQAEAQPAAANISLAVANVRGLELWQMSAQSEPLQMKNGPPRASIKLERAPLAEYDLRWELWYDSESFLPLRIQTTNAQGTTVSMLLENSILKPAP